MLQNHTMGKIDLRAFLRSKILNDGEPWYIDIILKRCSRNYKFNNLFAFSIK